MAGASVAYSPSSSSGTAMNSNMLMIACRYTLSLNALSAWTTKNGRKRRWRSRANWL